MAQTPDIRIRKLNDAGLNHDGKYVLVWMTSFRRPFDNFTLDRACEMAREVKKPVLVLEALRIGYTWASDRLHHFIIAGMADNARAFDAAKISYYPYLERKANEGSGLLRALAADAVAVVTDDYPAFFIPRMLEAAKRHVKVAFEAIDSNGLLPLRAVNKVYPSAYFFRRVLQKELPKYLDEVPRAQLQRSSVLSGAKPKSEILKRWPSVARELLAGDFPDLSAFDIDHKVKPARMPGGHKAGLKRLRDFVDERLRRYDTERNHPDQDGQSGLSPYLHHGMVGAHTLWRHLREHEDWTPNQLGNKTNGAREGYWGMSKPAEAFIDESITWRELGYNFAAHDYDNLMAYDSLPEWARKTLAEHEADPRDKIYTHKQLEAAETNDALWNAAQTELIVEGTLHNYMRMLWGKRMIGWTKRPREALAIMEDLNNKYGLDGRDPNSASGIMWCFGRYDRPWPEHDIFGKVRLMTSASTRRKLKLKKYLERYGTKDGKVQGELF